MKRSLGSCTPLVFLKNNVCSLVLLALTTPSLLLFFSKNFKTTPVLLKIIIPIPLILSVWILRILKTSYKNSGPSNENEFQFQEILNSKLIEKKQKEIDVLKASFKTRENQSEEQFSYIQNNMIRIQNENHHLKIKLHQTLEESQKKDMIIKFLKKETKDFKDSYKNHIEELKKENDNTTTVLKEYSTTIQEQREIINQKSSYILKLEKKIKDLIFEIRNLLQIEDPEQKKEPFPISSLSCFTIEKLKNIADKAENLESVSPIQYPISNNSLVLPATRYSLDCREFFDNLKNETSFILFIYSPKEKNFVFANSLFKKWIGLSPNIFFKNKEEVLTDCGKTWFKDLECSKQNETLGQMLIKTRSKGMINFYYHNRKIQNGPLGQHTIGILTPFEK